MHTSLFAEKIRVLVSLQWYRGGRPMAACLCHDAKCPFGFQRLTAEDPWTNRQRVLPFDIAMLHGQAQSARTDSQEFGGLSKCRPMPQSALFRRVCRNAVPATQCRHTRAGPTIIPTGA